MAESPDKPRSKLVTWRWPMRSLVALAVLLILGLIGAAIWLDSDSGHRFIIRQVEAQAPENGLRIRIDDIEGSIYAGAQVQGLELADPKGRFFHAGTVAVEWNPLAWIFNELNISEAVITRAKLDRLPELIDSGEDQPLLPNFDIFIGAFRADNLELGPAITGSSQFADLSGSADIRAGRAMVLLDAATTRSGDKILLALNAEPDREKLDIDAEIIAPAGGVLAGMLGLEQDLSVTLEGDGSWRKWDGEFKALINGDPAAQVTLEAREGLFAYDGQLTASMLPDGVAQKLAAPNLVLNGTASFENRLVALDLEARSAALSFTAKGGIDLGRNSLDAMRLETRLIDPSALAANLKAQDFELKALLNGKFSELRYQYLLTAPQLALGKTLLTNVRGEGEGQRDAGGWSIPVELSVAKLIGNGELLQQLLSGFNAKALLRYENDLLFAERARVATNVANGTLDLELRPSTGDFSVDIDANAPGFAVRGVGVADIVASINLGPASSGLSVDGQVNARLRRFDIGFLRELAGGLPELQTGLALGPDGLLRFTDLVVKAPEISFRGSGKQTGAATFAFQGSGRQDTYGRFDLKLDGALDRPRVALLLDSPLPALGLSAVSLQLTPATAGFAYIASGGSTLGPFSSNGMIVTATGQDTAVRVDRLLVSDTLATGTIRPTAQGLAGRLAISGGGVNGDVVFRPGSDRQLIRANLKAENARFDGNPPIFIRTGVLDADIVLIDGKSNIDATLRAQGISRGELMVGRIAANAKLVNGSGSATFTVAGTRGSTFEFQAKADITPDRYQLTGSGQFEGRVLRLTQKLDLRRSGDGWTMAPTTISYGRGSARMSGRWATGNSNLVMALTKMPLSLVDIAYPDLGLGGTVNGTVKLTQSRSQVPVGEAKLTVKGLTRSGLILTSAPVDLGLNIAISQRNAAARGIIKSPEGKTIGRFQGRVTGLGGGRWQDELMRKPLFAQARFSGGAESLWRLTGVETFDLTGPVSASADVSGSLANPQIEGLVRTSNARLESPLTGTVVSNIKTVGRFDGSRLVLPKLTGVTSGGGTVSGSGSFNFAVEPDEGIGIVMDINAQQAALIARDDFAATVTGPIKIRSSADGGLISGDVTLNRSFFRFGQASATASLPDIKTREINRRADERPVQVRSRPWRFDLTADAPNRLRVEGLGLDSEWGANLKITGPVDNFIMVGDANLIRGNYTFAGRRFRLERGRIRFVGNQPVNPILDIEAEANLTGLNATINVTGTGNQPEIAFTSIPALPQDELLSRVLFGASIADLSAPEAVQLAAAVASLNSGGGLDPINQLRKAVGLDRLRILPSDTDTGSGTSIAAGKYITRRVYVELITDGKGYSATQLEFQITRWLSILSTISTLGRQSANVRISKDY
ncbi:translocation/assembly module TamB domain-containing protein [Parasphingorhabdus flavimaris]|uniref:Translocation/assembly module TamB domain-containing protein n=1 Tax=Parasphingorhabdus flavimaris TaxID=266812 RepID=A0ABX2N4I8_9SPHN|nr:translocation/assembly module TamB domain-containing protein [Parasphingorhabdus flavimaris]NVD28584.1 translocation/assembly module TamB domain-containing protein [Parasphingorhabdus flavimaris]|tara:strand:+ start:47 stop:4216 length:4170 start_codon:yes stop_codon:yes gene_type:complete